MLAQVCNTLGQHLDQLRSARLVFLAIASCAGVPARLALSRACEPHLGCDLCRCFAACMRC